MIPTTTDRIRDLTNRLQWSIFTFCRSQFCMIEPTFQQGCHRYQDGRHQTEASMKSSIWPSHMPQNLVILLPFSKKGKLAPSKLHFAESESFFAQGFKVGYTSWEAHELGRILHNGTNLSKNECGAIFVGLAWGTGKTVHNGGEGECIDLTRGPNSQGCVHHKRGRMWVINTHSHYLTGIAWRSDSQAPVRFF